MTDPRDGKSVRLFLVEGKPGGITTAEMGNWSGHLITARRPSLPGLMGREEVKRTGVYLLIGENPNAPGKPHLYVGEGDVGDRLYNHNRDPKKDWFEQVVVMTSKDSNLTKTHVAYLEARFIALAAEAGRSTGENGTTPVPRNLPEAEVSDMEIFIEHVKILLPVLGVDVLKETGSSRRAAAAAPGSPTAAVAEFRIQQKETDATAREIDGEFVVLAGSLGRKSWTGTGRSYETLWNQLVADGVLVDTDDGTAKRFTEDTSFKSVSAASAVVLGRNSNGRAEWRVVGTGESYGDWHANRVPVVPTDDATGDSDG